MRSVASPDGLVKTGRMIAILLLTDVRRLHGPVAERTTRTSAGENTEKVRAQSGCVCPSQQHRKERLRLFIHQEFTLVFDQLKRRGSKQNQLVVRVIAKLHR